MSLTLVVLSNFTSPSEYKNGVDAGAIIVETTITFEFDFKQV